MKLPAERDLLAELEASSSPMWIFDAETLAFLAVNTAAVERYGFSRKEFLSMTILDIRPVEDVARIVHRNLRPTQRNLAKGDKWRHRAKDGTIFAVEVTSWEVTFQQHKAELVQSIPLPQLPEDGEPPNLQKDTQNHANHTKRDVRS